MFKVGDIVEGVQDGRWVKGRVARFEPRNVTHTIAIEVFDTVAISGDPPTLHDCSSCGIQTFEDQVGFWVVPSNMKLDKNHFVKQLIKDL